MFAKKCIRPPMPPSRAVSVHFVTDTEGHYPSLANSVKHSRVVRFNEHGRLDFHPNIKNPYFIFGGDLTDRGVGDARLADLLLDFKRRHADRVFLLVGNREASKSRFHVELNPKHIRKRLVHGSAPFWLLSGPHQLPIDYVKKQMQTAQIQTPNLADIERYVDALSIEQCQVLYLKWMLEQNLGCPHTFEYHKQYLAEKHQCTVNQITEYMVLQSIMEQNSPHGIMGEYLRHTQIAAIIPEAGIIAVHGGFTEENIGRLPTMPIDAPRMPNLHDWIDEFNAWYKIEVDKWSKLTHDNLPLTLEPARSTLDTFSIRVPSEYRSIVTSMMLDSRRRFVEVSETVSGYLSRNGIQLVLSGHQPCGDHPVLLRSKDDSVVFLNGDIGYANSKAGNVHDTRGSAFHTVQIDVEEAVMQVTLDASLLTGKQIRNVLKMHQGKVVDDTLMGKLLPNHELIQCRLPNGYYRTIRQEGFNVDYHFRLEEELRAMLGESRRASSLVV